MKGVVWPAHHLGTMSLGHAGPRDKNGGLTMVILLVFLLILLFAGLGFALHFLWIVAVVFLIFWVVGLALGRGESAGSHRFYKW